MTDGELRGDLPGDYHLMPSPMGFRNPGPTANLRGVEANTNRSSGSPLSPQTGTWCCERDIATSEYPVKDIRRERPTESAGLMRDGGIY